jgi:TPR repeat protein
VLSLELGQEDAQHLTRPKTIRVRLSQDFKEAIKWYRLAAAQGNLNAHPDPPETKRQNGRQNENPENSKSA